MIIKPFLKPVFIAIITSQLLILESCVLSAISVGNGAPPNGKVVYTQTKYRLGFFIFRGVPLNHPEEDFRKKMGSVEEHYTLLETQTFGDMLITLCTLTTLQATTYEVVK